MAKLWFRWVKSQGVQYARGIEGTWMCIWELVIIMPKIEDANTNYLARLLTPPPPPRTSDVLAPHPPRLAIAPKVPTLLQVPFAGRVRSENLMCEQLIWICI